MSAAQLGQNKLLVRLLAITLTCAFVFLGVKFVEYKEKWQEALLPGKLYNPESPPPGVVMPGLKGKEKAAVKAAEKPAAVKPQAAAAGGVGERSAIAPAAVGPTGLAPSWLDRKQPSRDVAWNGPEPYNVQLFFGIYFAMTGLHAFHVLAGMAAIAWLIGKVRKGVFGPDRFAPVDFVGLYWHLVDLVWIFLFPLLYLIS